MTRKGDWIQTYTGRKFRPLDARPEDVLIRDIAHALANVGRFGGHTTQFLSVAQHSVTVSEILEDRGKVALYGLLHDAAEAYLGDLVRPLKDTKYGRSYLKAEGRLERVIAEAFNLPNGYAHDALVVWADNVALATEARDLMGVHPAPWEGLPEPLPDRMEALTPHEAEMAFMLRWHTLNRRWGA